MLKKPEKAYNNLEFLNSPDARILRIVSEFLEPHRRFRLNDVRDTIVFFGSARIQSRADALANEKKVEAKFKKIKKPTKAQLLELRTARMHVEMSRYYEDAVELARLLTKWSKALSKSNRFVICSGGGPGIMEAANKGAIKAKGKSIGLNISIPFEQFANRYITPELNFEFHYFFLRKFWFVYLGKAMVIFPGGFGTMDEFMEVLTLMQTGKIKKKMTLVLYGEDYWKKILNFDEMVRQGVISQKDLKLFKCLNTPQEAFAYLKGALTKNYPTA